MRACSSALGQAVAFPMLRAAWPISAKENSMSALRSKKAPTAKAAAANILNMAQRSALYGSLGEAVKARRSGLLSHAERGGVSPLGGQAKTAKPIPKKGKA